VACTAIEHLDITGCKLVQFPDLSDIKKSLKHLNFSKIEFQAWNNAIDNLLELTALEELICRHTSIEGSSILTMLDTWPNIKTLDFEFSDCISEAPQLEGIYKPEDHKSPQRGANLTKLIFPILSGHQFILFDYVFFHSYPKLTTVKIGNLGRSYDHTDIQKPSVYTIVSHFCPQLTDLGFDVIDIRNDLFSSLASIPNLTSLSLTTTFNGKIPSKYLNDLVSNELPNLKKINIETAKGLTPFQVIKLLKQKKQYEELRLSGNPLRQEPDFNINEIEWHRVQLYPQPGLKILSLQHMKFINTELAYKLLDPQMFPYLESLNILGVPVFSQNAILDNILRNVPYLKTLTIGETLDTGAFSFDINTPLLNGQSIETLRIGLCRTASLVPGFWAFIFQSFPSIKRIRIFATGTGIHIIPQFWTELAFARNLTKIVFVRISRLELQEAQNGEDLLKQFLSTTKVHLIKLVSSPAALPPTKDPRCQIVSYGPLLDHRKL